MGGRITGHVRITHLSEKQTLNSMETHKRKNLYNFINYYLSMVVKAFNVDEQTYKKFSAFCKDRGMSMSKQVTFFMQSIVEEPKARKEYLEKLNRLRKEASVHIGSAAEFKKKYDL